MAGKRLARDDRGWGRIELRSGDWPIRQQGGCNRLRRRVGSLSRSRVVKRCLSAATR